MELALTGFFFTLLWHSTAQQYVAENFISSNLNVNPNNAVYLSWEHSGNLSAANYTSTKYRVDYSFNGTEQSHTTGENVTSFMVNDLKENTTYHVKLTTIFNDAEAGNTSLNFSTSALSFAVSNFTISNTNEEEGERLQLNWDHSIFATGNRGNLIYYSISYRDTEKEKSISAGGEMNVTFPEKQVTLVGLKTNTIYWVNVTTLLSGSQEGRSTAKGQTKRTGISNEAVAGIAIGITVFSIILIAAITVWHFKKNYPKESKNE